MSNAIAVRSGHTMDFTTRIEYAQRTDGVWFKRYQERGARGYRWGAWREGAPDMERTLVEPLAGYRLPTGENLSRAAIYAARDESAVVVACAMFGSSFWLCLADRSTRATVVRRTRAALLLDVEGREVWVPLSGLRLDAERAISERGEVAFATPARWFTAAAAEKFAADGAA